MNNYEKHARQEFRAASWVDENNKFKDEMQEMICSQVIELLSVFANHGHSGTTAHYAINLFKSLASFEPVAPLTGEDWEWRDISEYGGRDQSALWQNKRCSTVFKDSNGAYDIDGIVWYVWVVDKETGKRRKSHFTNMDSRVEVKFPYTPKREYKEAMHND